MTKPRQTRAGSKARFLAGVLLLVPIVFPLLVGTFARSEPKLAGFPFFYWYQFLWILIGAGLTAAAYYLVSGGKGRNPPKRVGHHGDKP